MCPIILTTCTPGIAQLYDLNFFRTYDYIDTTQKSVPYEDVRFEKASMVIEYNNLIASDPPPGLESVIQ